MDCLKLFQRRNDMNRVAMVAKGFDSPCHSYFLKFCHIQEAPIKDKWSKAVKSGFLTHSEGFNSLLRSKEQGLFRIGLFWQGVALFGVAVEARLVQAGCGWVCWGESRFGSYGKMRSGEARRVMLRHPKARTGLARQSRFGEPRWVVFGQGLFSSGKAWQSRIGLLGSVLVRFAGAS